MDEEQKVERVDTLKKEEGKKKGAEIKKRKKAKESLKQKLEGIQEMADDKKNKTYFSLKRIKYDYFSIYFTLKLAFLSIIFYVFHLFLNFYKFYSVRTLANANYVFLVVSVNLYGVAICYAFECSILKKTSMPMLMILNKYTLFIFLFCNVCLGIFNMLFQTLMFSLASALFILFIYSFIYLSFAKFLTTFPFLK